MSFRVYVSQQGNVFMTEIAEHLVEALGLGGRPAELVIDALPDPDGSPIEQLVVAPHEMFVLFSASEEDKRRSAAASVCINTEQFGTPFFDLAMRYAALGPLVMDISPFSLAAIRRLGMLAVHLPLGYVPSMDRWREGHPGTAPNMATAGHEGTAGTTSRERGIDIGFLGGRTPRREAFIAGAAGQLWEWRTDLRFFSWHRPARAEHHTFNAGTSKYDTLADTRILLNVHRGEDPYFEWARVVEAIANGCVVASERSSGTDPLVHGEHLLLTDLDDLAEQTIALAFDEPRRAAMAAAAYELLISELHQTQLVDRALSAAEAALTSMPEGGRCGSTSSRWKQTATAQATRARSAMTLLIAPPTTGLPSMTAEQQMLRKTSRDLKRAYLAGMANIRSIEGMVALVEYGDANHMTVNETPAFASVKPRISVVIPLYNQGQFLAEAVHSVIAASGTGVPAVELLIIDDHSTDDSLAVAEALLAKVPWFPVGLVARSANGGLPVARNTGFQRARGEYVFALDADNLLYPNGLATLAAHLDHAPAEVVAAYGLLERFDEHGSLGLTSHLPWDPDLLVHGAFIDAMAMFRNASWTALGGYADDLRVYGWEDYDLWLAAAERGQRADLVTRFVGRYREQPGSMRAISDIDMEANFVVLRERHPRLPWPS